MNLWELKRCKDITRMMDYMKKRASYYRAMPLLRYAIAFS